MLPLQWHAPNQRGKLTVENDDCRPGRPLTVGYPRMLLALVLEFESHRGEIFEIICKKKKEEGSTAESEIRLESTREERVDKKSCRDKNARHGP